MHAKHAKRVRLCRPTCQHVKVLCGTPYVSSERAHWPLFRIWFPDGVVLCVIVLFLGVAVSLWFGIQLRLVWNHVGATALNYLHGHHFKWIVDIFMFEILLENI